MVMPMILSKSALFRDIHYEPHPGQRAIHESTASRRIVACGVRWGKSLCAAMEALAAAMEPKPRSIGWIVGPTYDLSDKIYRELIVVVAERLRHRIVTLRDNEKRLVLRNLSGGLSEIRGKSADNPISLLGEGLDWLIIDEAARLKPTIWEGHLSQRLIDKRGWALLISTPRGKGYFYDLFRRGQGQDPDHASWNCPSWTNPHLDPHLIEEERSRIPERVFRQEYGGEFIEGSGQVFRNVRECATGEWQEPHKGESYHAGVDLGKVQDFSVIVVMNSKREVVHVDRFNKVDWSFQISRIKAATERYINAQPYPFTTKSKAALVDNLVLLLERREITLPRPELWPEGLEELEGFEYSVTDSGTVRTGAPGGMHDDCAVALALAAWNPRPGKGMPRITSL